MTDAFSVRPGAAFLWWAFTTRGTPRIASGVVTAASTAGVITALTGVAGEWQELLILGAGAVVSASLARWALADHRRHEPRAARPPPPVLLHKPPTA